MSEEIWKPIVGYEGLYEISSHGRVKSFNYRRKIDPRIIQKIIGMLDQKMSGATISRRFGVSQVTVSKIKLNPSTYEKRSKILSYRRHSSGYSCISLYRHKQETKIFAHTLVLIHFVGPKPFPKAMCRHLDGNPENNHHSNLKWGTRSENVIDSIEHGTRYQPDTRGTKNGLAKLNPDRVRKIRLLHKNGMSQKEISEIFGVGTSCIYSIVHGKTWRHIK